MSCRKTARIHARRPSGLVMFVACHFPGKSNFKTSELQNFRTSELQNFRTSELQNFRTSELQNFKASKLQSKQSWNATKNATDSISK